MQRNTVHPLGNLRTGDRFYFAEDKKRVVYQTTGARCKKPYVAYTQYPNATKPHLVQKSASAFMQVVFLRHTIPAPGDALDVKDLKPGDVFVIDGPNPLDIIKEYEVIRHFVGTDPEVKSVECLLLNSGTTYYWEYGTGVVFIRKQKEVKA